MVKIARGPKGERIRLLHDGCGRLIERHVEKDGFRPKVWHYGWDALDRLVSSEFIGANSEKERWVFAYDPFGRRVSKVRQLSGKALDDARLRWPEPQGRADTPAVGTAFLWDGDQLAAEAPLHLGGRIDWARAVKWHYADEGDFTPIAKELPDGALLHIVSDHLGTPKEMFDAKGELVWAADHHVWGAVRTVRTQGTLGALALKPSHDPQPAELHCPWRFPGQYEDAETGLHYNRHRHYDPLTGQYASPDPIGLAGGDRPQGYVSNPAVWVDPLGLAAQLSPFTQRYLSESGGRWGTAATRRQNYDIAKGYSDRGYTIQGGGFASEEFIRAPIVVNGSTKGSTYVDITASAAGQQTVRVQTVTTMADGITPTAGELAAAARIRAAFPNDLLILIPKGP